MRRILKAPVHSLVSLEIFREADASVFQLSRDSITIAGENRTVVYTITGWSCWQCALRLTKTHDTAELP